MQIEVCRGKIHRATVTEADLNYTGSITIDRTLMDAAFIRPYQMLQITNVSNATLWRTYALPAPRDSGVICLNGPPARLFQPGDQVIILSLATVDESEYEKVTSHVVHVDAKNRIETIDVHRLVELDAE